MRRDITQRTEACIECQTYKQKKPQPQPQLPIDTLKFSPGECMQVDLYELDKIDYITVVDKATGLIWSQKLANKNAATTVRALENIFLKVSMPFVIQTDNGKNFCSKEFEEFADKNNICKSHKMCPIQAPGEWTGRTISKHLKTNDKEGKENKSGASVPRSEPHRKNGMPSLPYGDVF